MTGAASDRPTEPAGSPVSSGISGLDTVLGGGFVPHRSVMVRGPPGAGKTLLGLHFLVAGADDGDNGLFINFGEPESNIRADAAAMDLDLDTVQFVDLTPTEEFAEHESYDVFSAAEVERDPVTAAINERVETVDPDRVFVDPMTQLRYLSPDDYQFRKTVLSLLRFLRRQEATVLFTSQDTPTTPDDDLQFMSDGILNLSHGEVRSIQVSKLRGSDFLGGHHTLRISDGGLSVFPHLIPEQYAREFTEASLSMGVPELDELLHGGLERGTVTILSGPTGAGKTTTGMQFMKEAAGRGERSVIYSFEESRHTLFSRCEAVNIPVRDMIDRGTLEVETIEPLRLTTDEFTHRVRTAVEEDDAGIVMIDGIDGYRQLLRTPDREISRELHGIGRYLKNMGVTTVLVNEVSDITGQFQATDQGISYLADNIVFLRHIEYRGELRKVIGVLKKRTSDFGRSLRRLELTEHGIKVGEPLTGLRGILTGTPEWTPSADSDATAESGPT